MSRIGKKLITLPKGVTAEQKEGALSVKGPKGSLSTKLPEGITAKIENNEIVFTRPNDQPKTRALHGLTRALTNNMVVGVSEGFQKKLEMVGVGYKASNQGQLLDLVLGYSHHFIFEIPAEIKVSTKHDKGGNPTVILESADKQLIGAVAAKIRSFRVPEPYKGKGIKFVGESLRRKVGKSAAKK